MLFRAGLKPLDELLAELGSPLIVLLGRGQTKQSGSETRDRRRVDGPRAQASFLGSTLAQSPWRPATPESQCADPLRTSELVRCERYAICMLQRRKSAPPYKLNRVDVKSSSSL